MNINDIENNGADFEGKVLTGINSRNRFIKISYQYFYMKRVANDVKMILTNNH